MIATERLSLERARGENARSMKVQNAHFQSEKSGWTRLKESSPNDNVFFFFISFFSLETIDHLFALRTGVLCCVMIQILSLIHISEPTRPY